MIPVAKRRVVIGVDPGDPGGAVALHLNGLLAGSVVCSSKHEKLVVWMRQVLTAYDVRVAGLGAVRNVRGGPKYGLLQLGANHGVWEGILIALGVPFVDVPPRAWQARLRAKSPDQVRTASRSLARGLWPDLAWTLSNAAHIADYVRRNRPLSSLE